MSEPMQGNDEARNEFSRFAILITDPHVRRQYDKDPLGTLELHGVNVSALPAAVQELLVDLSFEEVRLLAQMQETLVASGLFVPTAYGSLAHL